MVKLGTIQFEMCVKGANSFEDIKKKLSRIQELSNELDIEIDSISKLSFEIKPKV